MYFMFLQKRGQLEFYCFYIWLLKWHTEEKYDGSVMLRQFYFLLPQQVFLRLFCFIIITDNKIITGGKS